MEHNETPVVVSHAKLCESSKALWPRRALPYPDTVYLSLPLGTGGKHAPLSDTSLSVQFFFALRLARQVVQLHVVLVKDMAWAVSDNNCLW